MDTLTLDISNSIGYIKCGEIIKSQKDLKDPYILRCVQCKEIYRLLESFIFHLNDTCIKALEAKTNFDEQKSCSLNEAQMLNVPMICEEEPPVKLENVSAHMEDPLIVVKTEDIEKSFIKKESSITDDNDIELKSSINTGSITYSNQDEDEFVDEDDDSSVNTKAECESQESDPEESEIIQRASNTNGVSSAFVNYFLKSEENVTHLIAAFKGHPQLWNKTMPYFGNKVKRREYMIKIAEELKVNYNININGSQVSAVIVHLYRKFQNDLHRTPDKEENKKQNYVKPCYLTQMHFIKPFLENFSLEIIGANKPNLLPDQIVKILEIYKSLPHLWNSNLIENHCKNKRHESILEMLKQLETELNIQVNENELEQYLKTIHNNFSREKRRILNNIKSDKPDTSDPTNTNEYYEHLKFLYDHAPPLRCSTCGNECISPLHFKMHISTHNESIPFTCSQCHKTFKRVNVYTSHAKRHFLDLNYICKECGKKFMNYTNLRLHMRIHTGDKPYCCEMCGDSFRFLQTLSNHRRRHEKRYLHTCKICSQGFYSKMRHDDHMNSHMNIRSYICDICNKAFITKRALKQHTVVHEDVRKHACKLCGKTFKHKTGVNQHMKTHDIATTEERSAV